MIFPIALNDYHMYMVQRREHGIILVNVHKKKKTKKKNPWYCHGFFLKLRYSIFEHCLYH